MSKKKLLNDIHSPEQLKTLSFTELEDIAGEIRETIVQTVSKNGGHLASNLGVVELTLAIHKVFDAPQDKIIWDVGHQCYAHKILTGRMEQISTIRTENGISGFPKISESPYDAFNAGHSSTSISAAYGIKCANEIQDKDTYTVAVIGDGALTGGLAYEGLNNAGRSKKNFIVILNDNKMSISKNVGSIAAYLESVRIAPFYLNAKSNVQSFLSKVPLLGKPMTRGIRRIKKFVRTKVQKEHNTLFEDLGYAYYGPFDGHSIPQLVKILNAAKQIKGPVIVHVLTQKGRGYEPAEQNPKNYHGIYSFDIATGEPHTQKTDCFSDVFGEALCKYAQKNNRVCAITAAMQLGTGLSEFASRYKERFFDVGIAEEHAVTFAAGLASAGMIPVFAVYSTFLQRAYDQVIHDAAMQKHHIVLAVDRAGIVGEDGETHQGLFDVSFLSTIPNVTIFCPTYYEELCQMLDMALFHTESVAVVRYPRGSERTPPEDYAYQPTDLYSFYGNKKNKILIVTYGRLFDFACQALEVLQSEHIALCILKLNCIKPLDTDIFDTVINFQNIFFFEEGIEHGGIGEYFAYQLLTRGYKGQYILNAVNDAYVPQATVQSTLHKLKLDTDGMVEIIKNALKGGV